jgi:PRC-barrel domain protein
VHAVGSYVGVVTDVVADKASEYVIGLEVASANARRWFLPWAATTFENGTANAVSPLVFIPSEHLSYYVERGTRLAERADDGILVRADGRVASRAAAGEPASIGRNSAGEP